MVRLANVLVFTLALGGLGGDNNPFAVEQGLTSSARHLRQGTTTSSLFVESQQEQEQERTLGARPSIPSTFCSSDVDCDDTSYCAGGVCLAMGVCETNVDCRNPSNFYPVIECTGPLLCFDDTKRCGRECGPDCEDGSFPNNENCAVVPCDVAADICVSTPGSAIVSCQNDFCSGCNALVFDAAGNAELCSLEPTAVLPTPCNSTRDCAPDGSEYCSQGSCQLGGQCSNDADCFNPENIYPVIACVGPLSCSDDGQCGVTCSDSNCPVNVTDISPDCSPVACDAMSTWCGDESYSSCVDYSCGDYCQSFVFDPAGYSTCQNATDRISLNTTTMCETSSDCGEFQYCQQGICAQGGQCITDADCFNPENIFASIYCMGPLSCSDGQCGRTCSGSDCPVNVTDIVEAECSPITCDDMATSCGDNYTSCVDYSCGDYCQSFVFDQSGYSVCKDKEGGPNRTTCESTSDCGEFEYCQQGTCAEAGQCTTDADCYNPENQYAVILCIGPLVCSVDGTCGRTCDVTSCPPDQPEVECFVSPCEVLGTSCSDPVSSCVDYYCGDCNVFAFDLAGNQVCQDTTSS